MIQYTVRRLLATIPVLLLTSIIVFGLMRLIPGDPVELLVENAFTEVSDELIAKLRAQHGLDRPLYMQYLIWLGNFLTGDLGWSYLNNQAVWDIIRPRILPTVQIGLLGLAFAMLVAIPIGVFAAMHPRSWKDWLSTAGALIGAAMPYFLTGGLLIYLVSLRLRWLPASGYVPVVRRSGGEPAQLHPAGADAQLRPRRGHHAPDPIELRRGSPARLHPHRPAKGLAMRAVVVAHAFKNAILPVVTVLGIELGSVFSGAIITETIFAVPGIGRLLVDSILARGLLHHSGGGAVHHGCRGGCQPARGSRLRMAGSTDPPIVNGRRRPA